MDKNKSDEQKFDEAIQELSKRYADLLSNTKIGSSSGSSPNKDTKSYGLGYGYPNRNYNGYEQYDEYN